MRRWWPVLLVALLSCPFLGGVQADNPLDDDAQSGRDAGDTPATAVPLPADATGFHGRLTNGIDTHDLYTLELRQGEVLRTGIAGHQGLRLFVQGDATGSELAAERPLLTYAASFPIHTPPFVVPHDGTWYLAVEADGFLDALAVRYTVTIERTTPGWSAAFLVPEPAARLEFRWDAPVDLIASRMTDVLFDPHGIGGSMFVSENDRAGPDGTLQRTTRSSWATRVASTGPLGLGDAPPGAYGHLVARGYTATWSGAVHDILRHDQVLLATDDGARQTFSIAADRAPTSVRVVHSTTWYALDATVAHAESGVATPVLRVTEDMTRPFDVDGRLYGSLHTSRSDHRGNATLTDPSGTVRDHLLIVGDERGTWDLHVDRSVGVAHQTAYPYFFGADLPPFA